MTIYPCLTTGLGGKGREEDEKEEAEDAKQQQETAAVRQHSSPGNHCIVKSAALKIVRHWFLLEGERLRMQLREASRRGCSLQKFQEQRLG